MHFEPIGYFHSHEHYVYDLPHQPNSEISDNVGVIELRPNCNYEQAVSDLDGFSHIWIIFVFHKNNHWNPKVLPPRGRLKRGVFATRSPYRPNPIGISAVKLIKVEDRRVFVATHDLLDGTPILDIKPYLDYADRLENTRQGWIETAFESDTWDLYFSLRIREQLDFLRDTPGGAPCLEGFLREQLSYDPLNDQRKRVTRIDSTSAVIAYRTWRVYFSFNDGTRRIFMSFIRSGYTLSELSEETEDPYEDKACHRAFIARFSNTN